MKSVLFRNLVLLITLLVYWRRVPVCLSIGQGRLDGAFCEYSAADKMSFLRAAYNRGARNIEMESICFAAFCQRANVRGTVTWPAPSVRMRTAVMRKS